MESANPGIADKAARTARVETDKARAAAIAADLPAFLTRWYQLPFFKTLDQTQPAIQRMLARRLQNDPHWLAKLIVELSPGHMPNLWTTLPTLHCPLHYIVGSLDSKYLAIAEQVVTTSHSATQVTIEEAGHNTHLENQKRFIQVLETIL